MTCNILIIMGQTDVVLCAVMARAFFWFKAIVPVPYPIPHDGTVGELLIQLKRHAWRPSHMHFMFEKTGYDHLIT